MANDRLPFSISDPRSKCGTHFGASSLLVTKVVNGEKDNNVHSLFANPSPFLQEESRGGGGGLYTGYNEHRSKETKIQVP